MLRLMRSPLNKRLLSLVVMLLFVAGTSYHHLCGAGLIDCQPCEESAWHEHDEDVPCKSCGDSAELAKTAQPSKPADHSQHFIQIAATIIAYVAFSVPQDVPQASRPWAQKALPLASILRDIKRSIPIRGPSILV